MHDDDPHDGFGQHRPIGFSNRSFRWRPSTECYWGRCGSEGLTICHTLFLHPSVWRTLQGALQAQRGCTLAPQIASPAHQEAKKVLAALGTGYTALGIRLGTDRLQLQGKGACAEKKGQLRAGSGPARTGVEHLSAVLGLESRRRGPEQGPAYSAACSGDSALERREMPLYKAHRLSVTETASRQT